MSQESDNIAEIGIFDTYWRLYGGLPAIIQSWYFWSALVISLVFFPVWAKEVDNERVWTGDAVEIIPSLMAFSLGGMAILLAFTNKELIDAVRENGRADSVYMKTTASFFHFILVQTLSLVAVFATQAYSINLFSWLGFFLMAYGLLVAVAVAGNLLKLAQMFNLKGGS